MNRKNSKPSTTITFALLLVLVALLFVTFLPPAYAGGNVAVTRTFQPSTADTYIRSFAPDTNMGAETSMKVQSYKTGQNHRNNRVLVQFDFSQIPTGSTVTSATLSLYAYDPASTRTYYGHRVTHAWTENGVTWNTYDGTNSWTTPGGDYAASTFNAITPAAAGWMDFIVTNDVAGFVAGTYSNYGWLIKDGTEDSATKHETFFRTKEATEATQHPKLTVTYNCTLGLAQDQLHRADM